MEVFVTPGSAALDKFGLVSRAIEGFEVVIIHAFLILVVYHKIIATQGIILGALGALFRGPGRRRRIIKLNRVLFLLLSRRPTRLLHIGLALGLGCGIFSSTSE